MPTINCKWIIPEGRSTRLESLYIPSWLRPRTGEIDPPRRVQFAAVLAVTVIGVAFAIWYAGGMW